MAWSFCKFLIHLTVHLTLPVSLRDCFRANVKSCFKVKVNYIHYTPLTHQASCLIIGSYQVGEAWFLLFKSILTSLRHLLVLHVFGNGFRASRALLFSWGLKWGWCLRPHGLVYLPTPKVLPTWSSFTEGKSSLLCTFAAGTSSFPGISKPHPQALRPSLFMKIAFVVCTKLVSEPK